MAYYCPANERTGSRGKVWDLKSFRRVGARAPLPLSALLLCAACAAEPSGPLWETGDALRSGLVGEARIQYAQQSDADEDIDALFGIEDEEEYDANDPLEVPNRMIFAVNETLDFFILEPAAEIYRFVLPEAVRDSIRNALRNLASPVVLANDLLQGEFKRAETTLARFVINTTGGVLGLFDPATDEGYVYHNEDFGQTMGSYGVGEGAYLVLPLFGPSSIRDGLGRVADIFLDPLTYVARSEDLEMEFLLRPAIQGIDTRSRNIETLADLKRDSIDFYARVRSLWRQNRQSEINNGRDEGPTVTPGLSSLNFEIEPSDGQIGSTQ